MCRVTEPPQTINEEIKTPERSAVPASPSIPPGASTASKKSWIAAIFLATLVIAVNSWTTRHLGTGFENAFGITSLAAGFGFLLTVIEKMLPKEEAEALRISATSIPGRVVVGLWVAFICLVMLRSSVTVISDSADTPLSADGVRLTRVGTGEDVPVTRREGKDAPLRFEVSTSPFGRAYRLKVPGHIEQVVQVYPVTGLTIIPETDLRVSPSVLFRPPTSALQELDPKSGGKFQILKMQMAELSPLALSCRKSSYLFGREQAIPAGWAALWDLELKTAQISNVPAQEASTKLAWYRYTVLTPTHDLAPGDVLEARVLSSGNTVVAKARVKLGNEALKDVALLPEASPSVLHGSEIPKCPPE